MFISINVIITLVSICIIIPLFLPILSISFKNGMSSVVFRSHPQQQLLFLSISDGH